MYLRNPLTKARADALYQVFGFTRNDGFDNATDYVPLGDASVYQAVTVQYAVVLPVSGRTQIGTLSIVHDGAAAEVIGHAYSHEEPEIAGLDFDADVSGGAIRLVFTKSAVGENPTLFYRIDPVPVAV